MANTKPVGVAYSDPALTDGTTLAGGTVTSGALVGAALTGGTLNGVTTGGTTPGAGTFTNLLATLNLKLPVASVAALGTNQGTAAPILGGITVVTAADGTVGVILPTPVTPFGEVLLVKNIDVANAILKVYPAGSGIINALSASAALSMAAKTSALFFATSATQWYTIPLLPS